ncbi:MAG: hypothetical protein WKF94_09595 [Solirubrobacteraceae bacterium]
MLVFFSGFLRQPWPLCFVMPLVVIGYSLVYSNLGVNTETEALFVSVSIGIAGVALVVWWIGYALAPKSVRRQ